MESLCEVTVDKIFFEKVRRKAISTKDHTFLVLSVHPPQQVAELTY